MKILQLVTKRQYRGAEVFAANLSEELLKLGHEVLFAGLYSNDTNVLYVEGAKNFDLSECKKEGISPRLVSNLARLIKAENPDVVQCNGSDTLKYMVAASYFTREIPIVYRNISTISEWLDSALKKRIYKYLFDHVDYVTSVGKESIKDLRDTFGYPEHKTAVIRRGIPFKEYEAEEAGRRLRNELGLQVTDNIAIHVGNFSPEKNHSFLLDLFSEIRNTHPDIKLVCVGNGVTFEKIKGEILERGLEQTIFLMGFRKDIPELLAGSDCFVLSSLVEGVPGVILEAAVQKKPSVATNVGGVQEVIRHNKTGFIIDDFNLKNFREALLELLENHKLRAQMGEEAYHLALEEFNPSRNAKRFEDLYNHLIGKKAVGHAVNTERKLRVLQIIQKKQFRGAELFASQLSNHLLEKGHEVEMYSIYDGTAKLPFKGGVKTFFRSKTGRHYDINGWKAISEVVKNYRPDIVQANASDTLKYTVLSKIVFGWRVPVVYRNASISSYYIKNSVSKILNRELLKRVDQIVSVSEWSKKDLNNLFPFTRKKSRVITIGVEPEKRLSESPYRNSGIKNILHVGSLTGEKNHKDLLEMFKEVWLDFPDTRLHLIGEGPLRSQIVSKMEDLGLTEVVTLHGEIQKPLTYVSHADVLVLPSLVEGLPAVILEAMNYKTPVVAYAVGGIPEVLDNSTGFAVKSGDRNAFVRSVKEILVNHPEEKVEKAKERVDKYFMNEELVKKFLDTYYEVLR